MKTLVILGAARPKGHTRQMVDLFLEHLDGEAEIIDTYRTDVKPCMDCRYCWKNRACAIKDGMQDIYKKVDEADNIVLASPMYFHSVTGRILMVGGAPSFENQFLGGELVLKNLLNDLSAECMGEGCLPNSDRDSLETRPDIAEEVIKLAETLNKAGKEN